MRKAALGSLSRTLQDEGAAGHPRHALRGLGYPSVGLGGGKMAKFRVTMEHFTLSSLHMKYLENF